MERIDVVLALSDLDYRSAFVRAVSMNWSGFTFIVPESGCDINNIDADLVIFDEFNDTLFTNNTVHGASAGMISVYMTEDAESESLFEEPYTVYKYDNVTSIISKLKYLCGKGTLDGNNSNKCFIVSVISDEGGIGTTTFSLALSGMLNMSELKSLYVSLCPVNTCKNYGSVFDDRVDSKLVFSKFIYSCLVGRPLPVPSVIDSKNGINFIRCPTYNLNYEDFSSAISSELTSLLKAEGYKFLVYDIGNHFTANSRDIVSMSDIVVFFHSGSNRESRLKDMFLSSNFLEVMTADYEEIERYEYDGLYVPRCREGNFFGFNNEYGIEVGRIASVVGGMT